MTAHSPDPRSTPTRASRVRGPIVPIVLLVLAGCSGGRPMPPEAYRLDGLLVSFSPPPPSWHRAMLSERGAEGVRFETGGPVRARIEVTVGPAGEPVPARRSEFDSDSTRWRFVAETETTLAAGPARIVDYEWRSPGDTAFIGRDLTLVRERRRIHAGFLGLERDRRVFARLVATLSFPDSLPPSAPTGRP